MAISRGLKSGNPLLLHGGDIRSASQQYGIPVDQWIDLSTGINPVPYPVGDLPPDAYHRLPYVQPELLERASEYYRNGNLLPVPGSQSVIALLPGCLPSAAVLVPEVGYQEHVNHWRQSGANITTYPAFDTAESVAFIDAALADNPRQHLVVINPNNPTGLCFAAEQLERWAERLADGCYLIVDEAFIDTNAGGSVLMSHFQDNMIVLRSFGKFFGLAGIRLGFVFAHQRVLARLQVYLGAWSVNGPAQSVAIAALGNGVWQQQARDEIEQSARLTREVFRPLLGEQAEWGKSVVTHQPLFSTYQLAQERAQHLIQYLAERGILLRYIPLRSLGTANSDALVRIGILNRKNPLSVACVTEAVTEAIGAFG